MPTVQSIIVLVQYQVHLCDVICCVINYFVFIDTMRTGSGDDTSSITP